MEWNSSYNLIKSSCAFSTLMVLPFIVCAVIYLLTNICHNLRLRVGIGKGIEECLKTFLEGLELGMAGAAPLANPSPFSIFFAIKMQPKGLQHPVANATAQGVSRAGEIGWHCVPPTSKTSSNRKGI